MSEQTTETEARYPEPRPVVRGPVNGNAFAILAAVQGALRRAGYAQAVRDRYFQEATSGDYDKLLTVSMLYADFDL